MTDKKEFSATGLYKAGGAHKIHGHLLDYCVVTSADELKACLADGWHKTTPAAVKAGEPKKKKAAK